MKKTILLVIFFLLVVSAKAQTNTLPIPPDQDKSSNKETVDAFTSKKDSVYTMVNVDSVPMYPGGEKEFYRYISKNIVYPRHDLEAKIEGRVILSLIIEKDGSISNVKVLRSASPGMDTEAILVVSNSPKWKSGMLNSKPVRVQDVIPLSFAIAKNADAVKLHATLPILPGFPGGIDKFYEYLHKNSTLTKTMAVKGITIVSFTVERDGSISKARIEQSVSPALDKEAIRLILNSPKWNPGTLDGKTGSFRYSLPINFSIFE